MNAVRFVWTLVLAGTIAACSSGESDRELSLPHARPDVAASARPGDVNPVPAGRPRIVILGDSLTAGYGLRQDQSFPFILQQRLNAAGHAYEVVNAGVSGDTSAGGLRRLDWALDGNVHILVIELGANDGLRGLPVEQLRQNLSEIILRAQKRGVRVLLTGMEAPPNYGQDYTTAFRKTYRDLAEEYDVPLVPFLLAGVAGVSALNISDGIHPNPEGARIIAGNIWTELVPLLEASAP